MIVAGLRQISKIVRLPGPGMDADSWRAAFGIRGLNDDADRLFTTAAFHIRSRTTANDLQVELGRLHDDVRG